MIRRPPRSTRVRSSAASDVYKRQRCISIGNVQCGRRRGRRSSPRRRNHCDQCGALLRARSFPGCQCVCEWRRCFRPSGVAFFGKQFYQFIRCCWCFYCACCGVWRWRFGNDNCDCSANMQLPILQQLRLLLDWSGFTAAAEFGIRLGREYHRIYSLH